MTVTGDQFGSYFVGFGGRSKYLGLKFLLKSICFKIRNQDRHEFLVCGGSDLYNRHQ